MLDLYINFCDKTPEVMVLGSDVLCMRVHMGGNHERALLDFLCKPLQVLLVFRKEHRVCEDTRVLTM